MPGVRVPSTRAGARAVAVLYSVIRPFIRAATCTLMLAPIAQVVHAQGIAPPQADCLQQAADHYRVPVALVRAILKTEGGRPGQAVRNTNGSFDLGPMQINTTWLNTLQPRGITLAMVRDDYCVNVAVGTWILAREMQRIPPHASTGQVWQAVAGYHSRTPEHNARYAVLLWRQLKAGQRSAKL